MPHLVEPSEKHQKAFQDYAEDYLQSDESFWINYYKQSLENFSEYLLRLKKESEGIGLPAQHTAFSSYWFLDENEKILGVSRLRHSTNEWLDHSFGHIGFDVRPSERKKGHATNLLHATLLQAKTIGLQKVLLICDLENTASRKVIERNNAVFLDEIDSLFSKKRAARYWITT